MPETNPTPGVGVEAEAPIAPIVPRVATVELTPTYTDEQLLAIVQNRQLQLSDLAFQQLDFGRATAVTAYSGLLDQMAKLAQGNIKNKQDAGTQGAVAGAADMIATMLRSINRNDAMPLVNKEPDNSVVPPQLGDELGEPVLVPGNTTTGTESLSKEDFLKTQ